MKTINKILFILFYFFIFLTSLVYAQDLSTDTFVQQEIAREHWEPGGKHFPANFNVRGSIIQRSGEVNLNLETISENIIGNIKIQTAPIGGRYNYIIDLSNHHPHSVHSPFDEVKNGNGNFEKESESSLTKVSLKWKGLMNHPGNGYDGEQGGGFPVPSPLGAIDEYSFDISGNAIRHYYIPPADKQKTELPPSVDIRYRNLEATLNLLGMFHHGYVVLTNEYGDQYSFSGMPVSQASPDSDIEGYGQLITKTSHFVEGAFDYGDSNYIQEKEATKTFQIKNQSFLKAFVTLNEFAYKVNDAQIAYNPIGANSNSFAHQAIEELGYQRPVPSILAPGHDKTLEVTSE